jgi:hypothetical protein
MTQQTSEDVAECLRRAAEAEACAEATNNAKFKAEYQRIAQTWRTLARGYEFEGSLGRFISFNESRKKPLGRAARGVEREVYYKHVGPRFVNVTYAPDKDKFGCVRGWVASITDINNADVAD